LVSAVVAAVMVHLVLARAAAPKAKAADEKAPKYLSPIAMVADGAGKTIYIAEATAGQVAVFDVATQKVTANIAIGQPVSGVAISTDRTKLYITAGAAKGHLCIVDIKGRKVLARIPVGHTPMSPVVTRNGDTVYVCNRFDNTIGVVDIVEGRLVNTIRVPRQPVSVDLAKDGSVLLVANHLPAGPANVHYVAAEVTIIPTTAGQDISTVKLPNGSTGLRSVRISPDGKYAVVTHTLGRFHLPTTQLERGWMNTNAITLIDVGKRATINTFLMDKIDHGAANPWAAAWSDDSKTLCVTHAGTHEISVINFPDMMAKLAKTLAEKKGGQVQNDLGFMEKLRRRVKLPGSGHRSMVIIGTKAYIGEYFTDSISVVDIADSKSVAKSVALGPWQDMTDARRGEMLFNGAKLCFQMWSSCATCHPDGRLDSLRWDLMGDGLGNPRNTKSLLWSHKTPPSMITGIRANARIAIQAKIRHILFSVRPARDATDIYAYLKSIKPTQSPRLVNGKLSPTAQRGEKLFRTAKCASCHSGKLFTDLEKHDVGTGKGSENRKEFDTPTLIEAWRTAPYLYDGRALTILDVLSKKHNPKDRHGKTSNLTKQQLADLAAYVLSL
jgi:YVTN family beta-propeller protein